MLNQFNHFFLPEFLNLYIHSKKYFLSLKFIYNNIDIYKNINQNLIFFLTTFVVLGI